jgi:ABC-type antimicrobial peptide transport system permease subunit
MAYMVTRRRNEIGLRLALGARRADILGLVFAEMGRLLAIGLAVGVAASLLLSRYAESLLFGLAPRDITTMLLGGALLAATAVGAALIPARRAAALDPAVTLRSE